MYHNSGRYISMRKNGIKSWQELFVLSLQIFCKSSYSKLKTLFKIKIWKFFSFFLYIKFIEMIWVNKIVKVSSVPQMYITLCTHHPEFSPSLSPCIWTPLPSLTPPFHFPSGKHILLPVSMRFFCFFFCLFIHLLLSVSCPTYEWNQMMLIFFCLTYFSQHGILKVHPYFHKW